jgi:hypothetical protein
MTTLEQILKNANAYVDLEFTLPIGDDLPVRTNYAQRAVDEWASAYQWRQLKNTFYPLTTGATVSLPSDFRELVGVPRQGQEDFPEIQPEDRHSKEPTERYLYILGNRSAGHKAIVNNFEADATLSMTYQRYPSNMSTLTSVCEVPDPDYVTQKVISYVLQSRTDERFPIIEAEAKRLLSNMIGREMIRVPGGDNQQRRVGAAAWRIGKARG